MNEKIILVITILMILSIVLVSCGNKKTPEESNTTNENEGVTNPKTSEYKLINKDGKCYLVFDDASVYTVDFFDGTIVKSTLSYKSMEQFKNTVVGGELNEGHKNFIAVFFPKDENGHMVCDFNNLYIPTLPIGDTSCSGIEWLGEEYSYVFKIGDICGNAKFLPESLYESEYSSRYLSALAADYIIITSNEMIDSGKYEIYYQSGSFKYKRIRYSLSSGKKSFIIDKTYLLEVSDDDRWKTYEANPDVPKDIYMYCKEEGNYYIISLTSLQEDPTDEWLLSFGITPYIDSEVSEG